MSDIVKPRVYLCLNKQEQSATFLSSIFRSNKKEETHHMSITDDSKSVIFVTHDANGVESSTPFGFDQVFRESSSLQTIYGSTAQYLVSQFYSEGGKFTNGCFIVYELSPGASVFRIEEGNNGIADLIIEDIFAKFENSHGHFEISCLVTELRCQESKNIPYEDNEMPRGSFYCKCDSSNSVFELLKALNNHASATSLIITLKVNDAVHNTCGFFRIFLLPAFGSMMETSSPLLDSLSSLEIVFLKSFVSDQSESNPVNEMLTEILRSTAGISNTCILISLSSQGLHPQQLMRTLRLGSEVCTSFTTENIPNPLLIQGSPGFNDVSDSLLSLRASMINSSIMNDHLGEDSPSNIISPEKFIQSQEIQSDILLNLGKHLFEDADHACRTVLGDRVKTTTKTERFWAACTGIIFTLFVLVCAALFINIKMMNLSSENISCVQPEFVTNTTYNVNIANFELTRHIIRFAEELDVLLSNPEHVPTNLKYVPVILGLSLFLLASMIFSLVSMLSMITSAVGNKLKKINPRPKKNNSGTSSGRSMSSERKKINMKSESPYAKHPRIMSPIDGSKIFMSRYTGTVVLNNGMVAEVVRSSRIGTPSPSKYGTPSSCEKLVKSLPADSFALPALKEEEEQSY